MKSVLMLWYPSKTCRRYCKTTNYVFITSSVCDDQDVGKIDADHNKMYILR